MKPSRHMPGPVTGSRPMFFGVLPLHSASFLASKLCAARGLPDILFGWQGGGCTCAGGTGRGGVRSRAFHGGKGSLTPHLRTRSLASKGT